MKMSLELMVLAVAFFPNVLSDMLTSPFPYDVKESDGTIVEGVTLRGTSINFWEEDHSGYTITNGKHGHKVYARKDPLSGSIKPTDIRVNGSVDPSLLGTPKHIVSNLEAALSRKGGNKKGLDTEEGLHGFGHHRKGTLPSGTIKNLVVPMRFLDHASRLLPSMSDLQILFNSKTNDARIAPTGSIRKVFEASSFGKLDLVSTVLPIIPLSKIESEYADGVGGRSKLFWSAIREALQYIDDNKLIKFKDFDGDNDSRIDSFSLLHSGYGAEWGGSDCTDQKATTLNRIWSHKWQMSPPWRSSDGIRVSMFHISPLLWGKCGDKIGRIGVIAHETGHFLGLPDLYDTSGGGFGIGSFGLMANAWGFDGSQRYPPIMSPWSKNELGWLNCPVRNSSGNYTLQGASQFNECYKITCGFPSGEYLYIENRIKYSFDAAMKQGGLVIWHIDELGKHDSSGYPGLIGWPTTNSHYITPVLQADGQYDLEKGLNRGDAGDVFHGGSNGIDHILPSINVLTGPFPNTDSYQRGNAVQTNIKITNISKSGPIMTFDLECMTASPTLSPSSKPSNYPTGNPTTYPTVVPTAPPTVHPTLDPSNFPTHKTMDPSFQKTVSPTVNPTRSPSYKPIKSPTSEPTTYPTITPILPPTMHPVFNPTKFPTHKTIDPTVHNTISPTVNPTRSPTLVSILLPTKAPANNRARPCSRKKCNKKNPKWEVKCSKKRNQCGGCDSCKRINLPCKRKKCARSKKKWKKKCNNPKKCAGCPQCASN